MEEKSYYVEVSFSGRMKIVIDAIDEDDAKNKIFNSIQGDFSSVEDSICIDEVEWDLLDEAFDGNIQTPFIDDFKIEKSEDYLKTYLKDN